MSDIDTTTLVFFGDSLSDSGNLYDQTDGILPEFARNMIGGADGQISNGEVWSQQIGALFGSETVLNYAVAGAEAVGTQLLGDFLSESVPPALFLVEPNDAALAWDMNLGAQIDRFLADTAGQTGASYTAVVMIGGNDFANLDLTASAEEVLAAALPVATAVAENTISAVSELLLAAGSGVEQVVVVSMPEFSFYPAFSDADPADLAQFDALVAEMNAEIEAQVAALNDSLGGDTDVVLYIDFEQLSDALADDASSFGLVAPSNLTLSEDGAVLAEFDDDQVMFWDDLHPSEATHGIIAGFTAAAIDDSLVALSDAADELSLLGADASVVFAYGGGDTLLLGSGDDIAFGGSGGDEVIGYQGDDQLSGGSDADVLRGRMGGDVLDGGQDDDLLFGSVGNDVILDGAGSDLASGGQGDDTFIWIEETLIGGTGGATDYLFGRDGYDALYVVLSDESFAEYAEALAGEGQAEALSALGIEAYGMEEVIVLEGRVALDVLSDQNWYAEADLWGLV
ncbi:SGNH/GDSL hydrolase family protein [Flavimaricola marinus]|uniref:Hemolysin, chromosomal n=1 Tax=Flavimaricola marinus TaxID=1819565 RepID=A0A238L9T0_9RHOB|nr:SGNH/GDSL hydrolase family protein [Flavimaricola marinus]SMY06439.1 Hemolysin, chromosomal [Flavimaricola marinus]